MTGPSAELPDSSSFNRLAAGTRWASAVVMVVVLDQWSKWWWRSQGVINTGISGSLGHESSDLLVWWGVGVVLAGLGWWSWRWGWSWGRQFPWVLGLMWGGGFSNWLDRWWWGGVRDWLTIPVIGWRNNLADYAIALAMMAITWHVVVKGADGKH